MCNDNSDKVSILLAEYQAAIAGFNHFDSFRWQAGSLIIAGSLVLLGFLINSATDAGALGVGGIFITLLLAVWILFAHHYRQLYMTKIHRAFEIEKELEMKLNRRLGFLGRGNVEYQILGPKGHTLDFLIFILVALFGPVVSVLKYGFTMWFIPPVLVILVMWVIVKKNEKRMRQNYETLIKEP